MPRPPLDAAGREARAAREAARKATARRAWTSPDPERGAACGARLDRLRELTGSTSDAELARLLGCGRSKITDLRRGRMAWPREWPTEGITGAP